MTAEPTEEQLDAHLPAEVLRSEVNLLLLPFFALSRKELAHKDQTVYSTHLTRDGERVEVTWKVSRNINYRYPGPFDRRVHKAIEEILNEQPLPLENPIPFSIYDLCKRMGISTQGGKNYRKVSDALKTVVATTIESQGTFYAKGQNSWVHDIFHLYERIVFRGERLPDGDIAETNYLYLGSWYLDSINNRYVKPIDYDFYKSLRRTLSQRLYELLGVKFYRLLQKKAPYLNYRYSTLCSLLPATCQKYRSLARQQLDPAHRELIEAGFLADVQWEDVPGERDWMIYFAPGDRARDEVNRYLTSSSNAGDAAASEAELPMPQSSEREMRIQLVVERMVETLQDESSRRFYTKIAQRIATYPRLEDLIYRCLSEVKDEYLRGQVRTTRGAVFTDKLKRSCDEHGIDLGIKAGS